MKNLIIQKWTLVLAKGLVALSQDPYFLRSDGQRKNGRKPMGVLCSENTASQGVAPGEEHPLDKQAAIGALSLYCIGWISVADFFSGPTGQEWQACPS